MRIRGTTSRPTSPSIFFHLWKNTCAIEKSGKRQFVPGLWSDSTNTWACMSELSAAIEDFLSDRARRNDSPHTLRNYGADLREFLEYFSPPETEPPAPTAIDLLSLREWLGHLYERDQKPATIRRKLASLRALFKFLTREHRLERDPARLLRLPKMPKTL